MKRKMMIAMVLLALIPAVLIGYAANYYIQNTVRTDKLNALAGTVHMMALHLDNYYGRLVIDAEKRAEKEEVKRVLTAESPADISPAGRAAADRLLKESIGGTVVSGAVIDRAGKIVFSTEPGEDGLPLDKTELFRSIISDAKSSYIGLVTGKDNSDTFEIAVPIKGAGGEKAGVIKQTVKFDLLGTYLDSISLGKKGYAFLVRSNGYVIDQNGKNQLALYNEYQNNSTLEKLIDDFKQGRPKADKGIIEFENRGTAYIGYYEKVESIGCIAVAAIEKNYLIGNVVKLNTVYALIILIILTIAALGGYIIDTMCSAPVKKMNSTLRKISTGDLTARCCEKGNSEFMDLCRNINHLADRYQKKERELRLSSRIDNLTHLPNQNAIYEVLDTLLYKHPNQALVLLDIDGFKEVNDNLGYDIGDRILMEVGDILRSLPQHVCYPSRLGGAEFLIFVTNWTAPKYPEKIAEKIISRIEGIRFIDEIHVNVSANIGIEYTDADRTDKKKLMKYANIAMHKARSIGRNAYFVHYPYMQKE